MHALSTVIPMETFFQVLENLGLPETIIDNIIADAVRGFVDFRRVELYDGEAVNQIFVAEGEELGMVSLSGYMVTNGDTALPESTGLYLCLYHEDSSTDFVGGQGVVDSASGNFSATFDDISVGYSEGFLSFVALDVDDGGTVTGDSSVSSLDIVNEGCSDELRIKLEWDSDDDIELWVIDPNGDRTTRCDMTTDIAYINDRNDGSYNGVNPETGTESSFEEYVLFSGLSGTAMLGDYNILARRDDAYFANTWTLTVTMNEAVVLIETGVFEGSRTTTFDDDGFTTFDDDSSSRRQLFTSYYSSTYPQSDTFVVTLASYDAVGC